MMRKILFFLTLAVGLLSAGTAQGRLVDFYAQQGQNLPSVSARVGVAEQCGIYGYKGSYGQNLSLEACLQGQFGGMIGAAALPEDNYDTYLTAPAGTSDATIYVNRLPTFVTTSIYTIFASDGRTVSEKVFCTGVTSTPAKALTNCIRGIKSYPNADGSITEVSASGTSHSQNSRIAITDNINFSGKALAMLNGYQTSSLKNTDANPFTFLVARPQFTTDTDATNPLEFVTFGQLSRATSTGGGTNGSTVVKGVVQESTTSSNFSGNPIGSTGARLFISPATLTTSSDYATKKGFLPVLRADSQLDSSFGGNPGSLAQLNAAQLVVQNPSSSTSTPGVAGAIPISDASGTLNNWVPNATTSLPFTMSTVLDNSYYTYPIIMIPSTTQNGGFQSNGTGWQNLTNSAGTGGVATNISGGFASSTLSPSIIINYATPIMGTSSYFAQFGDSRITRLKFRMVVGKSQGGGTIQIGFSTTTLNDPGNSYAFAAPTTSAIYDVNHAGGRITLAIDGEGVGTQSLLSAVFSNNVSVSTTVITGVDPAIVHTYEFVINKSLVQIYIDNVLKISQTTNIPQLGNIGFGFGTNNTAGTPTGIAFTTPIISQQL